MTLTITVSPHVEAELRYMVELCKAHGSPNPIQTVEGLIAYVLASVADGSRRPGSWERQMLEMMGVVAECDEHNTYRKDYGRPDDSEEAAQ